MNNFLAEIKSQPQALRDTLNYILNEGKSQFLIVKDFIKKGGINKLIFTGAGSSFISTYLPYYILNQYGITTEIRDSGEFLFNLFPEKRQDIFKNTGIVIISQSGESSEIRELLRKINSIEDTPLTIGITNNPNSYLASMTELQILMNFDKETSVTSKSYVCTLLLLYVLAKTIIGEFFITDKEHEIVEMLIKEIDTLITKEEKINKVWTDLVDFIGTDLDFIEILSRGSSMVTAYQAALSCKEILKTYSEACSISSFRHGGIECLNDDTNIILITADNKNLDLSCKFLDQLINKWKCKKILHITNQNFDQKLEEIHNNAKVLVYKHGVIENHLAPIMEIIILQLLFYKIAEKRGIDPGVFYFSKKVINDL
ncbi:MAG: SIS domain-containing protein [Promethearchaeota archaeon]